MTTDTAEWIDIGIAGSDLVIVEFVDGAVSHGEYLVVRNSVALAPERIAALEAAGFVSFASQSHAMAGSVPDRDALSSIFPDAKVRVVPLPAVRKRLPWKPALFGSRPSVAVAAERARDPEPEPTPAPARRPAGPFRVPSPFVRRPAAAPVSVPSDDLPPPAVEVPASPPVATAPRTVPAAKGPTIGLRPFVRRTSVPVPAPPPVVEPPEAPASDMRLNAFQMRYEPGSKLGTPIAAIPVSLHKPTLQALERVREQEGDIDAFVARRLQWSLDELERYLSPEQIDAVALGLSCSDLERGFLLGDQTGLGKGRVVAALIRAYVLEGGPVVVVTEKPNLFSDLYRDIADIGSMDLIGRPFVVNGDVPIFDTTTRATIHEALDRTMVTKAIKQGKIPAGFRLVLSSYSQFNRLGSPKADFIRSISKGRRAIFDECHNAVGDSNTSKILAEAMDGALSVSYSSATFARDPKNLAAYRRLFPQSMQTSDLEALLTAGGRAISEGLSQMLAESGSYLRREQDLSGITLEVVEDAARRGRNKAVATQLAPILSQVAQLQRSVAGIADLRNAEAGQEKFSFRPTGDTKGPVKSKEYWYAGNFGSRLSTIVRQFVTALLTDLCVERCEALLAQGIKPVVVIESTMESLMRLLAADDAPEDAAPGEDSEALVDLEAKPADFKDALRMLVDRTMQLSVKKPGAKDAEKIDVVDPELVAIADQIRARVDAFSDLPLSPIDEIIDRLSASGYTCGEISARGMKVSGDRYVAKPVCDRIGELVAFNKGETDALVITRAASTGLSLHASEKFVDQRKRCMVELQIPSNVVERIQFFGRVNRRGQVVVPGFETLSTGLPLQTRNLAMQNRKLADLSANVTGSSESSSAMAVPDLLDAVGNAVAREILEARPSLAASMFIPMKLPDPDAAAADLFHINKLLQRLSLLPADMSDQIFEEVVKAYESRIADLAAKGQSPKGARDLGQGWSVASREIFEPGSPEDGPVFGRPVWLTTIEREVEVTPWTSARLKDEIAKGRARRGASFDKEIAAVGRNRKRVLHACLTKHHLNVESALKDQGHNPVKEAALKLDRLIGVLRTVSPGCVLVHKGSDGKETGVVVDVVPPPEDVVHQPGRWTVRYVVAGEETPKSMSLAGYIQDPTAGLQSPGPDGLPKPEHLHAFDRAPSGMVKETRRILDGNPVKAVISARNAGWSSLVAWIEADGTEHRSVVVPRNQQNAVATLPGRVTDPAMAHALMDMGAEIWTNATDPEAGASLAMADGRIVYTVKGGKKVLKEFADERIAYLVGTLRGDDQSRYAYVDQRRLPDLLAAMKDCGHAFHYPGTFRRRMVDALAGPEVAAESEDPHPAFAP